MPSKGVDYDVYLNSTGLSGTLSGVFSGPKVGGTLNQSNNFQVNNLQIDSSNIHGIFNYDGPYTWSVNLDATQLATQTNVISSLTGNIVSGTMTDMMNMPPIFTNGATITYGFYDSGPGTSGLTNQDQSWVYCTRDLSNWMGGIAAAYPAVNSQPFYNFVLPGAHDAGMNTMATIQSVLTALELVVGVAFPILGILAGAQAPTIIMNAAITQKDTIANMLGIGCRYFDFRPGTMYPAIPDPSGARYHQHAVIPGLPYIQFLEEVLSWLSANPSEIVVVSCNTQGFADASMNPTASQLGGDLQTAITNTGITSIVAGDASDLGTTYGDLLQNNKRLIFLNQIAGETTKYDSYSDSAYQTLNPSLVVSALSGMNTAGQQNSTYTVLQLQATASGYLNNQGASGYSGFVSVSSTASPLMSTKLQFDSQTLPWVVAHASANLTASQPIVLLNDFIDNATVDTAVAVTLQRMGISGSF